MKTARPPKMEEQALRALVKAAAASGAYRFVGHALDRLQERFVTEAEVQGVLANGWHEVRKDEFKAQHGSWNYAWRCKTIDDRHLRIAVAVYEDGLLVVTVIAIGE